MAKFLLVNLICAPFLTELNSDRGSNYLPSKNSRAQAILDLASENKAQLTGINAAVVIWFVGVLESLILAHSVDLEGGYELSLGIQDWRPKFHNSTTAITRG